MERPVRDPLGLLNIARAALRAPDSADDQRVSACWTRISHRLRTVAGNRQRAVQPAAWPETHSTATNPAAVVPNGTPDTPQPASTPRTEEQVESLRETLARRDAERRDRKDSETDKLHSSLRRDEEQAARISAAEEASRTWAQEEVALLGRSATVAARVKAAEEQAAQVLAALYLLSQNHFTFSHSFHAHNHPFTLILHPFTLTITLSHS